jgi:hypothetical protein
MATLCSIGSLIAHVQKGQRHKLDCVGTLCIDLRRGPRIRQHVGNFALLGSPKRRQIKHSAWQLLSSRSLAWAEFYIMLAAVPWLWDRF